MRMLNLELSIDTSNSQIRLTRPSRFEIQMYQPWMQFRQQVLPGNRAHPEMRQIEIGFFRSSPVFKVVASEKS